MVDNSPIIYALRDARLEHGYSVYKLSEITGMPRSTISRIESGQVAPTIASLEKIAQALGKELTLTLT